MRLTAEQYAALQARNRPRADAGTGDCEAPGGILSTVPKPASAASSKYRNRRTDGYASAREARRASALRALQDQGAISALREQVSYSLIPSAWIDGRCVERACKYIADFVYLDNDGREVIEDCKGCRTALYVVKRKLMLHLYGIRIMET